VFVWFISLLVSIIWRRIFCENPPVTELTRRHIHLLWSLLFIKIYASETLIASYREISRFCIDNDLLLHLNAFLNDKETNDMVIDNFIPEHDWAIYHGRRSLLNLLESKGKDDDVLEILGDDWTCSLSSLTPIDLAPLGSHGSST